MNRKKRERRKHGFAVILIQPWDPFADGNVNIRGFLRFMGEGKKREDDKKEWAW